MELDYKENIKKAYTYSPQRLRQKGSVIFSNKYEEERLDKLLKLTKKDILLDACCGYGRWALRIASKVSKVVAADFSKPFIDELKSHHISNIEAICADLSKLRYKNYFDIILCSGGLEHFQDKQTILEHLLQTLKNDGRIYVSCWTSDMLTPLRKYRKAKSGEMKIKDRSWYIDEPSREDLMRIMVRSGFMNVQVEAIYGDTHYIPKNSDEAFRDYIQFPRKVNIVNIAYAIKPKQT